MRPEPSFSAGSFTYEFPRPMVTIDVVLFTVADNELKVLLVRRGIEPFKGVWALPGGFVRMDESLDVAARRELFEETNVSDVYLEQLFTFGDPGRDPRGRVISVSYFALIASEQRHLIARTDAAEAAWGSAVWPPKLAFDHARMLEYALQRLRYKLEYSSAVFQLLPRKFTLTDLQHIYEVILDKKLDKRNFRKKILGIGILEGLDETRMEGPHRPAKLYALSEEGFVYWKERGILFPF